jgi:hypothetical protein
MRPTIRSCGAGRRLPHGDAGGIRVACMATNGGTQDALQRCSCAIDVVASVLPYEQYEMAETVLRMRRSAGGYLGQEFRAAPTNAIVRDLEEAEVRCF